MSSSTEQQQQSAQTMVKSDETTTPSPINLAIVQRLRQIQLVHQTLDMIESSYSRFKSSNSMVNMTLTHAESMANQLATPVIHKLEQPINMVDNLACQSFDTIQSGVSKISNNQMVGMVQKRVDDTVEFVQLNSKQLRELFEQRLVQIFERAQTLRKQATENVNSVMNVSETVIKSVDKSITAAESALDRLLPPLNPETETALTTTPNANDPQSNGPQRLFQRMICFSDKLRRRIAEYTITKWLANIEKSGNNFRENIMNIINSQLSNLRIQMNNMANESQQQQQQQQQPQQQQAN